MYILIEKSTDSGMIIRSQRRVAEILGVSDVTIRRKHDLVSWETANYKVFNPVKIELKLYNRGSSNPFRKKNS
jgi:transcription initiation factor TFIIIB Brf1 subunit/transcription initiation factor TFIIB